MTVEHAEQIKAAASILQEAAYFAGSTPAELTAPRSLFPSRKTMLCACTEAMSHAGISYDVIAQTLKTTIASIEHYRHTYSQWSRKATLLIVATDHLKYPAGWFHTRTSNNAIHLPL